MLSASSPPERPSWTNQWKEESQMTGRRRLDDGATATEYVLLLAGIAVAIMLSIFGFGAMLHGKYVDTCNSISTGMNDPAACH
jgi:Flp pilus assembly pilin Flp